ncbi:MAG: VOC family protein [Ignavibacteriae bacterium]|nr:VOC family protein [Ignavibacteriota bacterium]
MNHFTYVEIPTLNLKKAEAFFSKVFEWKFEPMRGVSTVMYITSINQGPGGLIFKTKTIPKKPSVIVHIEVDNIDEKLKAIEKSKGRTILPKTLIPGQGWYAYFATPDGCTLGLWQTLLRAA